jgi:hypothetical protein
MILGSHTAQWRSAWSSIWIKSSIRHTYLGISLQSFSFIWNILHRLAGYYSCPSTFVHQMGRGHGGVEVELHSLLISYLDKSSGWLYGTVTLSLGKRPWCPLDRREGEYHGQPLVVQKRNTSAPAGNQTIMSLPCSLYCTNGATWPHNQLHGRQAFLRSQEVFR